MEEDGKGGKVHVKQNNLHCQPKQHLVKQETVYQF